MFERFLKDEAGVTAIEYGLIASATGLALIAVMPSLNIALSAKFAAINNGLQKLTRPRGLIVVSEDELCGYLSRNSASKPV